MLEIKNISKCYGKFPALTDVSLEISPGMFGLLGPNGAGKTTLMRIITTLLTPTAGEISMGNINWKKAHLVRNMIGYLPQKFSLYKNITVKEVLHHIAVLRGFYDQREKMVVNVLEKVNLLEQKDKKIKELSGGMIRRVGIAQAILGDPQIIVVDEPTAGLDPAERIRFRRLLHYLSKESIVIISTHIVEDIAATCEQAAILHKGKILKKDDLKSLSDMAKGKVWSMTLSTDEYFNISKEWNVISSQHLGNKYNLRIISETPPNGALSATPSLEDAYLYLMGCVSE